MITQYERNVSIQKIQKYIFAVNMQHTERKTHWWRHERHIFAANVSFSKQQLSPEAVIASTQFGLLDSILYVTIFYPHLFRAHLFFNTCKTRRMTAMTRRAVANNFMLNTITKRKKNRQEKRKPRNLHGIQSNPSTVNLSHTIFL